MKVRAWLLSAVLIACLFLVGCNSEYFHDIYDDSKLIANSDSYAALKYASVQVNNRLKFTGTLSGARTVWSYSAQEDMQMAIACSLQLHDGSKAKLVLVQPGGEVITLLECLEPSEDAVVYDTPMPLLKGTNKLKLVGYEKSKLELHIAGSLEELGKQADVPDA